MADSKRSRMVEIYEEASKRMFGFRYPQLGAQFNPYGEFGLDAKVFNGGKLISVDELKFNSHGYHRLEDIGKGVLIEHKKLDELRKKAIAESKGRKTPVWGLYRRFFADAELIMVASMYTPAKLKKYYTEEMCEPNQWTNKKTLQKGYYIPLYDTDEDGDNYWFIKPYNAMEKRVHAMILEERDNQLNTLK